MPPPIYGPGPPDNNAGLGEAAIGPAESDVNAAQKTVAEADVLSDGNAKQPEAEQQPPPQADCALLEDTSNWPAEQRKIIERAARDVRVLISYLSRKRESIPTDFDYTVANKILSGKCSQGLEQKLWGQLMALADLAHPATAESISDSRFYSVVYGEANDETSKAHWPLRLIQWAAFGVFLLTFCLGVYAAITGNIIDNARKVSAERTSIILGDFEGTRLQALVNREATADASIGTPPQEPPPDQGSSPVTDPTPPSPGQTSEDQNIEAQRPADPATSIPPDEIPPEWGELDASDPSLIKTFLVEAAENQIRQEYETNAQMLRRWNPMLTEAPVSSAESGTFTADNGARYTIFGTVVFDQHLHFVRIITDFVIPMLAAFLGVSVYIIRDTAIRLESVSLSPMDADGYIPRVILGLIAGLSIGWLTPPSSAVASIDPQNVAAATEAMKEVVDYTTAAASLSKTALAFVVGYSIEVLFNILDGIKAALGVRSTEKVS